VGGRAFDLLCALTGEAGKIVTTRDLMSHVWGKTLVGEGSLRFQINSLRKALAQDGLGMSYIKNVTRRGYVFVVPVHRHVPDESAASDIVWKVTLAQCLDIADRTFTRRPLTGMAQDLQADSLQPDNAFPYSLTLDTHRVLHSSASERCVSYGSDLRSHCGPQRL
jgi:hypothetical protein